MCFGILIFIKIRSWKAKSVYFTNKDTLIRTLDDPNEIIFHGQLQILCSFEWSENMLGKEKLHWYTY